jgi:hypothetical protein
VDFSVALSTASCAAVTSASADTTEGSSLSAFSSAASSCACAAVSCAARSVSSTFARSCPVVTWSPSLTSTSVTSPLTAKLRSACCAGSMVPLAETVCRCVPTVAVATTGSVAASAGRSHNHAAIPPAATTTTPDSTSSRRRVLPTL